MQQRDFENREQKLTTPVTTELVASHQVQSVLPQHPTCLSGDEWDTSNMRHLPTYFDFAWLDGQRTQRNKKIFATQRSF